MQVNKELRDKICAAIDKVLGTAEPRFKVFHQFNPHYADVRDLSKSTDQTIARFWDIEDAHKYAAQRNKESA